MDNFFILTFSDHNTRMFILQNMREQNIIHCPAFITENGVRTGAIIAQKSIGTPEKKLFVDIDRTVKNVVTGELFGTVQTNNDGPILVEIPTQEKTITFTIKQEVLQ